MPSIRNFLLCLVALAPSACGRLSLYHTLHRGQVILESNVSQLQVGQTSRTDVRRIMGSPALTSLGPDPSWFYVSETTRSIAFTIPTVIARQILEIQFDKDGNITELKRYSEGDGKTFALQAEQTDSYNINVNPIQRLLRGIGKIALPRSEEP